MNYRGSYRHLVQNSKAAMLGAIEIYNKPRFDYRDECFVILLLNAWELALKALLSKKGASIYYPKRRGQPYKTLSWQHALDRAEAQFPKALPSLPVRRNLELLGTYRDNAVHFYNAKDFGSIIYPLAQTSIVNYRDLLANAFALHLEKDISWQLMPLGLKPPIDAISYITSRDKTRDGKNRAVRQFLAEVAHATEEVEDAGADTGRLLTVYTVKLESTKKIEKADLVVGVTSAEAEAGPLTIVRRQDPNVTHPLRQTEAVADVVARLGPSFTTYVFQAILWKYDLKNRPEYCWQAKEGVLTKYSNDVVAFIGRLANTDIAAAKQGYRDHLRAMARKAGNISAK